MGDKAYYSALESLGAKALEYVFGLVLSTFLDYNWPRVIPFSVSVEGCHCGQDVDQLTYKTSDHHHKGTDLQPSNTFITSSSGYVHNSLATVSVFAFEVICTRRVVA